MATGSLPRYCVARSEPSGNIWNGARIFVAPPHDSVSLMYAVTKTIILVALLYDVSSI
jgi:hypothetical protein